MRPSEALRPIDPETACPRGARRSAAAFPAVAVLLAAWMGIAPAAAALTVEGVRFDDRIRISSGEESARLPLRGAGLLRYRIVFRGYVAALYLPESVASEEVLADVPKRIEISYFWGIDGAQFGPAAEKVLERQQPPEVLESLRDRLDRFHAAYRRVEPGDRYALTYVPGRGTELSYNGEALVRVPGADFAEAYFGIWLDRQSPLDAGLREELLSL